MNLFVTIGIALAALMRNKVRSFLTILGIIIGIAAVIAIVAVGQGASVMVQEQIKTMGDNILMVFPGSASRGGFHFGGGTRQTLTAQDAEAIQKECPYVRAISPIARGGGQIVYQEKNWFSSFMGVNTSYLEVRNWQMETGSFFTNSDLKGATKVCVLGKTVAKELFDTEDPTGKIIRVRNVPFKILGVLETKGSAAFGQDQDDIILMPWTTLRRVIQNTLFNDVNQIMISIYAIKSLEPAKKEITAILRQRHNLAPGADDDFSISDMAEITKMITSTTAVITLLLAVVASISLVVGGIGIMNIMLVSVTERTREIGLRMAVGAQQRDILFQFLTEAIILALIGGIFGIILGSSAAYVISQINKWPILISVNSILIACIFSGAVGIFFGFYPAWRASRLDIINALRYE